jgi:hypothetical protein
MGEIWVALFLLNTWSYEQQKQKLLNENPIKPVDYSVLQNTDPAVLRAVSECASVCASSLCF